MVVGFLIDSEWIWFGFWEIGEELGKEKEEKEKEKEDNKIGVAEKRFHYCHACCRFVIAILGLAKGVPFVDLFSFFFLIRVL